MRIQHNIAAMSSYRNYTNNVSAVNKNLEKLSSGYKINRAGDDAAGLAISEKMRAQISGLEAAQKNAKDGISLVKTAEGALTEVHDMLNRMVTLATQSANGTYDNETDRYQLQKEVNQLRDEINRIADSSNFNGIKLLDGSMDGTAYTNNDTVKGLTSLKILEDVGGTPTAPGAQVHKDAGGASKTSFTIDLNDLAKDRNLQIEDDDGTIAGKVSLWLPNTDGDTKGGNATAPDDGHATDTSMFNVVALDFSVSSTQAGATQIADAIMNGNAVTDGKINLKFTVGGSDYNVEYEVVNNGDGTLTFNMTDTGAKEAKKCYDAQVAASKDTVNATETAYRGHFNFGIGSDSIGATTTDAANLNSYSATKQVSAGGPDSGLQLAMTKAVFEDDIRDGAGLKIGDQYYIWACSDKTLNTDYGDGVTVVDVRHLADTSTKAIAHGNKLGQGTATSYDNYTKALNEMAKAINANNKMWTASDMNQGESLYFQERVDNTSDADLTTAENIAKTLQKFNSVDMTAAVSGKKLTLQIGDTADDYNQLKVNIKDCHADAIGIGSIDISTQAGAQDAVAKIKAAINTVSDVRGTLGATQNRLEHTINNLSVMTENIQDAESTIRDTDIAEEMMAYTKNNILVQASQAMLAQANQIPQGVLQLLG